MRLLNNNTRRVAQLAGALVVGSLLAACGGGDPYTGLWQGTVNGRTASAIMLGDGTYYLRYGGNGSPVDFGGVVRGTGEFRGATFTSNDGVDYHFNLPPTAPTGAKLSGKLGGHQTVTGTMNGKPLSVTYLKPFDPDGKLEDLAGSYPGEVTFTLGLRQTTFDVKADGTLTTELNGCQITGKVVPRNDDAFNLTIQFQGAPCVFPYAVFQGAAVYSHDLKQLEAAVVNNTYGQAISFVAKKP